MDCRLYIVRSGDRPLNTGYDGAVPLGHVTPCPILVADRVVKSILRKTDFLCQNSMRVFLDGFRKAQREDV